ncbi:MAG: ribonuclease III [Eubacterium sp.]|nr:ribonuclease III [Eubacterium sp.]
MDSKNLLEEIHEYFPTKEVDIRSYAPLKLAYLGDAVFEIFIRTIVIERVGGPVKNLHRAASRFVNAGAQSKLAQAMLDELDEDEMAAYRHGRNAKTSSVAKHADIHDYRNATGLEALCGYLYLKGQSGRAVALLQSAMDKLGMEVTDGSR